MKYLQLLLLAVDVFFNVLLCGIGAVFALDASMLAGSWNQTLSARAGSEAAKNQRFFAWCARVIDAIPCFGAGHCAAQYEREKKSGGVWAAWINQTR